MNEIDLKQSLFLVMGSLSHETRQYLDEQFRQFDLTRPEWLILALLRAHKDGISQSYARSYVGVETSYLTKVLNRLEEKNFIVREIDLNNRRNRIIKINPKSLKTIKKIFAIIDSLNEEIQRDLNEKQMRDLYKSLATIGKRLKIIKTG
ncbi:unnamed protein product [marine sediment metagenome]|uniref:HTH marR-type domain-containing protein n=1 Tax=marine sediment metagenome TaxID=412755 RepID=X1BNJ1_9ZZZZ